MRKIDWLLLFMTGAFALALQGCSDSGESSAAFSADEDAYRPPTGSVVKAPGSLASTAARKNSDDHVIYGADFSTPGSVAADADSSSDFDNLEIVNPTLRNELDVLRVGSDRTDTNLLSVFAGVKNKSAKHLDIEVQTVYRDKDGHRLTDSKAAWIPISLKPHGETQYHSVAISEDATDFVVRIRHASSSSADSGTTTP